MNHQKKVSQVGKQFEISSTCTFLLAPLQIIVCTGAFTVPSRLFVNESSGYHLTAKCTSFEWKNQLAQKKSLFLQGIIPVCFGGVQEPPTFQFESTIEPEKAPLPFGILNENVVILDHA